ncbi:MAG: hypothetical protein HY042_01660 [Spirochaetia bacterium]|nr:hypothetical protein [Spirochaetia bacterium]
MSHETVHLFLYPGLIDEQKLKAAIGTHQVFLEGAVIEEWQTVTVLQGRKRLASLRESDESVTGNVLALTRDQVHRLDLALPDHMRFPVLLQKGPRDVQSYRVKTDED